MESQKRANAQADSSAAAYLPAPASIGFISTWLWPGGSNVVQKRKPFERLIHRAKAALLMKGLNRIEYDDLGAVAGVVEKAIGVGFDALIRPRQTIYRSSAQTAFSRVHVAPLIGSDRRGIALKWSF